jgi:hypothetical protein
MRSIVLVLIAAAFIGVGVASAGVSNATGGECHPADYTPSRRRSGLGRVAWVRATSRSGLVAFSGRPSSGDARSIARSSSRGKRRGLEHEDMWACSTAKRTGGNLIVTTADPGGKLAVRPHRLRRAGCAPSYASIISLPSEGRRLQIGAGLRASVVFEATTT